ncbi:MAG: PHP-associated domain-containing protein [Nanoarchaeota archaeon]|nr:PHP-associated domain-containing protein [Nanoarchaeota archaeon]
MILKKTLIGVMVASMVYCGVKTYKKPEYMDVLKETAKMKIEAVIDNSPKIKNNEFYMDTHMHLKMPSDYKGIEEIVDKAMEKVDVMVIMNHDTSTSQGLDYDTFKNKIKQSPKYEIKDYGKYVEIKTKYDTLIAIKAQELRTDSGRDVLAIGCDGIIKTSSDVKEVIREIHKQNGIAIIAHPMSIAKDSFFGINIADENERKSLELICYEADALEEFNSQNYLWLLYSNVLAESFIKKHGLPGTAGSDTHYDLEQIGLSGIIVEKDSINMDDFVGDLKKVIKNKKFKLHKEYTSPVKFGKIMAFPLLKSKVESLF